MVRRLLSMILLLALMALIVPAWAAPPKARRLVLANGLIVLHSEEPSLPLVVFELIVDAGSKEDPVGSEGLANLTASGMMLGTSEYDVHRLNEALDFLGASFGASANKDFAVAGLQVLKKDMEDAFRLFFHAVTKPVFPAQEIEREKQKIIGLIRAANEQPAVLAEKTFQEALFPESRYGHPVRGFIGSVPNLQRKGVLSFYREFYQPARSILAIVGDVSAEEVDSVILPILSAWPSQASARQPFQPTHATGPKSVTIDRQTAQASIVMGNIGLERSNPDYYPLTVMNYILGGGFGSYLFDEIRVKRGLVYSVSSGVEAERFQGSFQVLLQTKNSSANKAITLVEKQLIRIRTEPVSDEDLGRAKKYLTGSFPMRFDSQAELAGVLARIEYYRLGLDYLNSYPDIINAVTKEDVLRVAKQYVHPQEIILAAVADLEEARIAVKSGKSGKGHTAGRGLKKNVRK